MGEKIKVKREKSKVRKILEWTGLGVFITLIAGVCFLLIYTRVSTDKTHPYAPAKIGDVYMPVIVQTDSMEPDYPTKSAIFVRKVSYQSILDDYEKIELVKKCILNHSSRRKEYRTTEEENILVNADAMAHFDCIESLYSLAFNVMGLNENDSIQFVKDKLTKDYLEIDDEVKSIICDKYKKIMKSSTLTDMIN